MGFLLAGAVVWCLIGMLCIYAMFLIALSSIALAVLLALGPLFIAMLFFEGDQAILFGLGRAARQLRAHHGLDGDDIGSLAADRTVIRRADRGSRRGHSDGRCTQYDFDRGARVFDIAPGHADCGELGGRPRAQFVRRREPYDELRLANGAPRRCADRQIFGASRPENSCACIRGCRGQSRLHASRNRCAEPRLAEVKVSGIRQGGRENAFRVLFVFAPFRLHGPGRALRSPFKAHKSTELRLCVGSAIGKEREVNSGPGAQRILPRVRVVGRGPQWRNFAAAREWLGASRRRDGPAASPPRSRSSFSCL